MGWGGQTPPQAAQRDAPSTRAVALEHVKPQLARFRRMHRQRVLLHVAQHVPPHTPTTMLPRAVNANANPAGSAAIQRTRSSCMMSAEGGREGGWGLFHTSGSTYRKNNSA
jgi:hypothetical protein